MQKFSKKQQVQNGTLLKKNTKKYDFFESFLNFLIFFQEIPELKKGLKNIEKKAKKKWKICTFFEKNSACFPRQKKKGKKI